MKRHGRVHRRRRRVRRGGARRRRGGERRRPAEIDGHREIVSIVSNTVERIEVVPRDVRLALGVAPSECRRPGSTRRTVSPQFAPPAGRRASPSSPRGNHALGAPHAYTRPSCSARSRTKVESPRKIAREARIRTPPPPPSRRSRRRRRQFRARRRGYPRRDERVGCARVGAREFSVGASTVPASRPSAATTSEWAATPSWLARVSARPPAAASERSRGRTATRSCPRPVRPFPPMPHDHASPARSIITACSHVMLVVDEGAPRNSRGFRASRERAACSRPRVVVRDRVVVVRDRIVVVVTLTSSSARLNLRRVLLLARARRSRLETRIFALGGEDARVARYRRRRTPFLVRRGRAFDASRRRRATAGRRRRRANRRTFFGLLTVVDSESTPWLTRRVAPQHHAVPPASTTAVCAYPADAVDGEHEPEVRVRFVDVARAGSALVAEETVERAGTRAGRGSYSRSASFAASFAASSFASSSGLSSRARPRLLRGGGATELAVSRAAPRPRRRRRRRRRRV